eukprot:gene20768-15283_t
MKQPSQVSETSSFLEEESRTSSDMILQPARNAVRHMLARQTSQEAGAARRPSYDSHAESSLTGSVGSRDEKASTSQPLSTTALSTSISPPITPKA